MAGSYHTPRLATRKKNQPAREMQNWIVFRSDPSGQRTQEASSSAPVLTAFANSFIPAKGAHLLLCGAERGPVHHRAQHRSAPRLVDPKIPLLVPPLKVLPPALDWSGVRRVSLSTRGKFSRDDEKQRKCQSAFLRTCSRSMLCGAFASTCMSSPPILRKGLFPRKLLLNHGSGLDRQAKAGIA